MTTPTFSTPYEFDLLLLEPIHHMMMKGIRINPTEKKRLQDKAIAEWDEEQDKLDRVIGMEEGVTFNVASKKWVPWLLYDHIGLPPRKKKGKVRADEAALRELMAFCQGKVNALKREDSKIKYMTGFIICRQILNIRNRRKQISSFLGLRIEKGKLAGESPFEDEDGRLRTTVSIGGTKTMRFSHSKVPWVTEENIRRFHTPGRKINFEKLKSGVNNATIPDKLKTMFVPDDGYEFAEFDLNRGESWIYAHLSEDPELLRIHTEGLDFHAETASAISGEFGEHKTVEWIIEHKKGAAFRLRYTGKRVNHASAYRMRAFKGAEVVNKEADETGVTVTVSEYNKAHKIWLAKYFNVPNKWWPEIEEQLGKDRTLTTPYGRKCEFHDAWGDKLFRDATAYVPQSTSVDYLNRGLLRVYHEFVRAGAWGLSILAQTHDSILVQYREKDRDEVLPAVAEALGREELTIKGRTFRIPIEASVGMSWGGLEGYALT